MASGLSPIFGFSSFRRSLSCCFISLFLCIATGPAVASWEVDDSTQDISDAFQVLVDPNGDNYSLDKVLFDILPGKIPQLNWEPNRKSWGYGTQTLWLHAAVHNPSKDAVHRVLALRYSCPSEVTYHLLTQDGTLIRTIQAGTFSPIEGRDLKLNIVGIYLDIPAESTILVVVQQRSKSLLDTHYDLRLLQDHQQMEWIYLAAYGLYFGLALALFVHNLSLFVSVYDRVYLAYLAFVLCMSATMLFSSAYYALFWYRMPAVLHNMPYATPAFSNIGAALFASAFLRLRLADSKWARAIWLVAGLSFLAALANVYQPEFAAPLNPFLNIFMAILSVSACISCIVRGERYAWFLLGAILCPVLSVASYYLGNHLFKVSIPSEIMTIAFALEMILMSVGLSHRIYVLKRRQRKFKQEQAELLQNSKMRALNNMASGVAHEVNNPLMIIGGYAEVIRRLIKREPLNIEKIGDNAQRIITTVDRIAFIVQALRSFAHEQEETNLETLCMQDIVHQGLALCESRIHGFGIELKLDMEEHSLFVKGNQSDLIQVLLSLIDNAILAVAESPKKWIHLTVQNHQGSSSDMVTLSLEDSGSGIAPEFRSQLFHPFFTTRVVGSGAGLSLSRALGILTSLHGKIYFDENSAVTRFVIELPQEIPTENFTVNEAI